MSAIYCHVLALPDFHLFSGGAAVDRIEKTRLLADWELAKRHCIPATSRESSTVPTQDAISVQERFLRWTITTNWMR